MLIKVGATIKTDFLRGKVEEIIEGKARGWRDTWYYKVKVLGTRKRKRQIVRLDEVKEVRDVSY